MTTRDEYASELSDKMVTAYVTRSLGENLEVDQVASSTQDQLSRLNVETLADARKAQQIFDAVSVVVASEIQRLAGASAASQRDSESRDKDQAGPAVRFS